MKKTRGAIRKKTGRPSVKKTSGNGGRFKKGQPRPKGAGRKKGSKNKVTASFKQALLVTFDKLGGVEHLYRWAFKKPTEFYKILGRVIPVEAQIRGDINVDGEVDIREIARGLSYILVQGAQAERERTPRLPAPTQADPAPSQPEEKAINPDDPVSPVDLQAEREDARDIRIIESQARSQEFSSAYSFPRRPWKR